MIDGDDLDASRDAGRMFFDRALPELGAFPGARAALFVEILRHGAALAMAEAREREREAVNARISCASRWVRGRCGHRDGYRMDRCFTCPDRRLPTTYDARDLVILRDGRPLLVTDDGARIRRNVILRLEREDDDHRDGDAWRGRTGAVYAIEWSAGAWWTVQRGPGEVWSVAMTPDEMRRHGWERIVRGPSVEVRRAERERAEWWARAWAAAVYGPNRAPDPRRWNHLVRAERRSNLAHKGRP